MDCLRSPVEPDTVSSCAQTGLCLVSKQLLLQHVNERLIWRMKLEEHGLTVHRYWSSNCETCSLKPQCTTGKERRVTRWEYEAILESMQDRLDSDPEIMRVRGQTVEHPYGMLKL